VLFLLQSDSNPGWELHLGTVLRKTPEESDGFSDPHEDRPKVDNPGGINHPFLHPSYTLRTGIFPFGMLRLGLIIGGVGHFLTER